MVLSSSTAQSSKAGEVPTISERLEAIDALYHILDAPLGIDQFAIRDFVINRDTDRVLENLRSHGAKKSNVQFDEDTDEMIVSIPLSKGQILRDRTLFNPERLDICLTPDTLKLDYFVSTNGDSEKEINHIKDLFKLTGGVATYETTLVDDTETEPADNGNAMEKGPIYYMNWLINIRSAEDDKVVISARISTSKSRWYCIPSTYMPEISFATLPPDAPCNKGSEPFNNFVSRFNTDPKFRQQRCEVITETSQQEIRKTPLWNPQMHTSFNQMTVNALDECKLLPLEGQGQYSVNADGEKVYDIVGEWYYPSANRVIYSGWNTRGMEEYSNNSVILLFERVGGKWFCTNTQFYGEPMSNAVKRQYENGSNE